MWSGEIRYHIVESDQGTPETPRLFTGKNHSRTMDTPRQGHTFHLVVDDSGIKYSNKKDSDHLIAELQTEYEVTQDWKGGLYCIITLKWEHATRKLYITMSGYAKEALHKFQHPTLSRPNHLPHQSTARNSWSSAPQFFTPQTTPHH